MKTANIRKTVCIAAAVISASLASCGKVNTPETPVAAPAAAAQDGVTTDIQADDGNAVIQPDIQTVTDSETASSVIDRFSDADYIEKIADGRYLVMYRDYAVDKAIVYDAKSDTQINECRVECGSNIFNVPVIYQDKGFGFIVPHDMESTVNGYYYDINGELVNDFVMDIGTHWDSESTLAPDGSAMYVVLSDKADSDIIGFTDNDGVADKKFKNCNTQIYAVYADGEEKQLAQFDAHTDFYSIYATADGEHIALDYFYHPEFREGFDAPVKADKGEPDEFGIGLISTKGYTDNEMKKIYTNEKRLEDLYVNDDKFTVIYKDEVIRLVSDENGEYSEAHYPVSIGDGSSAPEAYISASGDYMAYPTYTSYDNDVKDTQVNVVRFEDGEAVNVYQKQHDGWFVHFRHEYELTMIDEQSGELVGGYDDLTTAGKCGQVYRANIFND